MDEIPTDKTFCEFFAGIGLVHEGLRHSGWQCAYANDIEPKKHEMYRAQFGDSPYYHVEDVWNTDAIIERITDSPFLATASFPCVDLSIAGHWKGFEGEHSSTYFGFLKLIERLRSRRPRVIMLENVYGFLTSHKGKDFESAIKSLAGLGYWMDAIVLDAKWFVPQSRPRTFVFGFHDSIKDLVIRQRSERLALFDAWRSNIETTMLLRPKPLLSALENLRLPTGWATFPFSLPKQRDYSLLDFIDLDGEINWWDAKETLKHYVMMESPSKSRVDAIIKSKGTAVGAAFRRTRRGKARTEVRFDLSGCLRTPKGGSAKQIVVAIIRGKLRMRWMTAREYARLQGAGEFAITVPEMQALYGFGDAVCVPAIRWIDQHILTPVFEASRVAEVAA